MRGAAKYLLPAYGALLVLGLTWPFFLPGEALALRDMMVLPDMALTRASLGFGDLPARNVPQDALLGMVPFPVFFVRALVISAAAAAAFAGHRLGTHPLGKAAAMTVAVWNPFVIERLLQGQWSLAVAAWLIPLVALGGRTSPLAQWVASLTPTGALAAACFVRNRAGVVIAVLACAPWVVSGVLATGGGTATAASAAAFAPRAEQYVGTLGALMGLGGIWNSAAVPASRAAGFALLGIPLFILLALGWRAVPRRWLALAGAGFAVALASWAGLTEPVVTHVPGGGLIRDAQKSLILAIPAFVAAAGALTPRRAAAALACALLQVPDGAVSVEKLRPTAVEAPTVAHAGRDVFFAERAPLTLVRGEPTVDPAPKQMNVVESGALLVDGTLVDPPSPRWVAAHEAVEQEPVDTTRLRELEIGLVVYPDGRVLETGAAARGLPPVGLALFAGYLAALGYALAALRRSRSAAAKVVGSATETA
ncbi:hypothetical protein [Corynebacterium sp. HMSC074A01]|uniref:hypothetical protein n=1 Tax=Corynebacterium sp. HMSC074A01 TaxID=1715030 RepID=UPI0008A15C18|nr:hypothetical protein [Corynebacterium sp. HMSC074A01]OHF38240.1 hypothetical protein HMPREF2550_02600 [Corynebacterium sp. HMSC074A01]